MTFYLLNTYIECSFSLLKNNFTLNQAGEKGGALFYNMYSPSNLINNNYYDNRAVYGNNYASFPYKLKIMNDVNEIKTSSGANFD